jgi:hypothetical protein
MGTFLIQLFDNSTNSYLKLKCERENINFEGETSTINYKNIKFNI